MILLFSASPLAADEEQLGLATQIVGTHDRLGLAVVQRSQLVDGRDVHGLEFSTQADSHLGPHLQRGAFDGLSKTLLELLVLLLEAATELVSDRAIDSRFGIARNDDLDVFPLLVDGTTFLPGLKAFMMGRM